MASYFERADTVHCLAAVDLGAGVEQPFDCLIVQNRQAVQSMVRSMDWTLEDNMVDGLFVCATLTGRRGGHNPFVQAGAEMSDTGAEAVKADPRSFWKGHSRRVDVDVSGMRVRSLLGLSNRDPPRAPRRGATSSSFRDGGNFHEISFDDFIVII